MHLTQRIRRLHSNACTLNEEVVEGYVLSRLAQGDVLRFEEHLLICEDCRRLVSKAEIFVTQIREASDVPS